ncbi:diguanylate cyclase [Shewanella sediminis HAW-EB3]|uniref:diguanylate cyclase n=1 Tax=Shewanella sediminis (strain HAW-EB3) TaxID=425104 RepID=A8FRG9_SHESH|nr:GGDEF domain-containing protein [Shewanella sediminis]ABV35442.1 diguanylate cyclase [Shewanella sediminis HAW-EB3]
MSAALISLFLATVFLVNMLMQPSPMLSIRETSVLLSPVVVVALIGTAVSWIFKGIEISNRGLNIYLFMLEAAWIFVIWQLFYTGGEMYAGHASLTGVEALVDVLVLTFAIALFPDRRVMFMAVLPLMLSSFFIRFIEIPANPLFPVTKLFCILAILVTGQKVLYSWFKKAIVRDVEKQYLLKQFRRMALVDGLTNISNRRHFDEILSQEIRASERNNHPLSLILIDIDYFKRLNDSSGHQVGDECLVEVAKVLAVICHRPRDLAARYGGEEFVLLLPDTGLSGGCQIAKKVRDKLAGIKLDHPDSELGHYITVSQGVCQWREGMSADDFISKADTLLYRAKSTGRDRYVEG